MTATTRALVADDEPRLARALVRALHQVWPELEVCALVEDGDAALEQALALRPDVLFLDIQMPGRTGLEIAAAIADEWSADAGPLPLFVFVTAFEQFAVAAFERAAVDYLLKPVMPDRLAVCAKRVRERLGERMPPAPADAANEVQRLAALALDAAAPPPHGTDREPIRVLRVGFGDVVRMVPLADVLCLEAVDKYVNVVTEAGEGLVRMSLRELAVRLEGVRFEQVHRATLVNSDRVTHAQRDALGHWSVNLRGLAKPVRVSRAFAHLFRPM
jgi:DNA-binding LytR/AlgR family response regulator